MSDDTRNEELQALTEELRDVLSQLRTEMTAPPRGPLGLPRPPTPREVVRFTESYTIPTIIAILEANIRALELFQRVLQYVNTDRTALTGAGDVRARAGRVSAPTLERLDRALSELGDSLEEGLPENPEARQLVQDARRLSDEIATRVAEREPDAEPTKSEKTDVEPTHPPVNIDVEDELQSIKRTVSADDERPDDGRGSAPDETEDRAGGDR